MSKHVIAAIAGAAFGAIVSYVGLACDHYIESSSTSTEMYARDARYFWFTIPSLPGEAVTALTSSRDWSYDDAWRQYFWPIMIYNILFWLLAFLVGRVLYRFIISRVRRGHAHI